MEIRADDDSSSFSNTINDQWSKSPHGGFIGDVKLQKAEEYDDLDLNRTAEQLTAIKEAGTTDAISAAWTHYNWDKTNDTVSGDRTGRASCQMCHTATGAMNYLNDPDNYDPANNDYSHLDSWNATDGSTQNELLYCWGGCHSNNSGDLRNPGAITLSFTVADVNPTLPDLGKTNTCINCHTGRGNMDSLGSSDDPLAEAPPATSATKTHYFNVRPLFLQQRPNRATNILVWIMLHQYILPMIALA